MARLEEGALLGKLGNIVGCRYKGRYYLKRAPVRRAPRTEAELANNFIFTLVGQWLKPVAEFVKVGFKGFNSRFQGFTAARSMLYREGLHKDGYNSSIDPSVVLVSYGTLGISENLQAVLNSENTVEFTWNPATSGNKGPRDRVMLLAYNIIGETAVYETNGPKRHTGSAHLSLTNQKPGTYHLYVAFLSEDATRQSNSSYLGTVQLN